MASVMPFLIHQFIQRDKTHKVIGDADVLPPLAATLVGSFNIHSLNKFPQGIGRELVQILVFVYPLDELLQIFNLSFLYFNILLQGLDFQFKLFLLSFIASAHHRKPFIADASRHIVLIDADEQPVKLSRAPLCLFPRRLALAQIFSSLDSRSLYSITARK